MATLKRIDELVGVYSTCLNNVAIKLVEYKARLFKLELWARDVIGPRNSELRKAENKLLDAISKSPHLFDKPKTMTTHNVKFGIQKSKTVLEWDDEEKLLMQIKEKFPALADVLIKKEEKPVVSALMQLTKEDLKRLPLRVVNGEDYVLIKPDDKDVVDLMKLYTNGRK